MDALQALISVVVNLMKIEFTVWDFTLSWWEIMLYGMIVSIALYLIVRFLDD